MSAALAFAPATFARPIAATRLLVVRVASRRFYEASPADLAGLLDPGDVVVVNDAATMPASISGATARGDALELRLLALPDASGECDAVVLGAGDWRTPTERRAPPPNLARGDRLDLCGERAVVVRAAGPRRIRVGFEGERDAVIARLYRVGKPVQYAHIPAPLPLWDVQNVYAAEPWAAEMPSAGRVLDFAQLDALRRRGVAIVSLTHGAGLSSIGDAALDASLPWTERYRIPEATAAVLARASAEPRGPRPRVVAVGTSVVRALESSAAAGAPPRGESRGPGERGESRGPGERGESRGPGDIRAGEATTDLRIDSRHRLRVVTALLTGMHDGATSHADLVSAFIPRDLLSEASDFAARRGFRGHELGDSCLILGD